MNAMQLAMADAGIISKDELLKAEALKRKAKDIQEGKFMQELQREEELEREKKKAEERKALIRWQTSQLAKSDDGERRKNAHKRFIENTPKKVVTLD